MAAESRNLPNTEDAVIRHRAAYKDRPDEPEDDGDGAAASVTICVVLASVVLFVAGLAAAITHVIDRL